MIDYLLLSLFSALNNLEMTDSFVEKVSVDKFYSWPVVTLKLGSVQKTIIHKNNSNECYNVNKDKRAIVMFVLFFFFSLKQAETFFNYTVQMRQLICLNGLWDSVDNPNRN